MLAERKSVVVLFSDLRSFSTFSENMEPELVVLQLNEYFEKMVQCIVENGGTIDKFIGDAIMAVFGGLLSLENPCQSAVKAADDMQRALALQNEEWQKRQITALQMGIGLHFGEVLEGTIGSKTRKEFTVIGDTVNTAARLESESKNHDSSLIVSESVYSQLDHAHKDAFVHLGEIQVKGKSQAIRVYGK